MAKDSHDRVQLIRKGNEFFNQGKLKDAIRLFLEADYKDGLARVGDHFYYERKEPVNALSFYKKAGHKKGIDLIIRNIVHTVRDYLRADRYTDDWQDYLEKNFNDSSKEEPKQKEQGKKIGELEELRNKLKDQNKS